MQPRVAATFLAMPDSIFRNFRGTLPDTSTMNHASPGPIQTNTSTWPSFTMLAMSSKPLVTTFPPFFLMSS